MAYEIVKNDRNVILQAFTGEKLEDFLAKIKEDAENFVPDLSTAKSRKMIASKAYEIAQKKTTIDGIGKELAAEWKAKASKVDESRRKARTFLDGLKEKIRKPLTEWEEEEAARAEAQRIAKEIEEAHEIAIKENENFDLKRELEKKEAQERAEKEAREAEERRLQEEKEREEREARIALEAKEKAEREAAEKIEEEKRARIAAEEKAERERRESIAREEKAKADALQKERERVAEENRKKAEEEERVRAAEEKRIADEDHRKAVKNEAYRCFRGRDIDKETAVKVIDLIDAGFISNITINY